MSNKTILTAEQGAPIIRIERMFDAPRDKVFAAFVQKDKVAKWWSPGGTARIDELDAREGGTWKFIDIMPDGQEVAFYGSFHEVTAPERIVQTSEFDGLGERGHAVLDRYEFSELDDGRTQLTLTEAYLSLADRDMAIANNMEEGLAQSYVNLDKILEKN